MRAPNDGRPGPDCFVAMRMKFPHLAPLIVLTRPAGRNFWRRPGGFIGGAPHPYILVYR